MNLLKPAVGVAAVALATGIALPSIGDSGNKYDSSTVTRNCDDGDTVTLNGPLSLWPPNHKMVDEPVTGHSDAKGPLTLTLTPQYDEVALQGDGGPQHDPDWNATTDDGSTFVAEEENANDVTAGFQLRAERSGQGDGRTYTIDWVFESPNGTCESGDDASTTDDDPFVINVPHDMRGGANWKS